MMVTSTRVVMEKDIIEHSLIEYDDCYDVDEEEDDCNDDDDDE